MKRVAVIGGGIAGLGAAWHLEADHRVTLFEAAPVFGGHAHTVDVTLDGVTAGVDTGFLVFNDRTYPRLRRLFAELGVPTAEADMSFSVQAPGLEWSGSHLGTVFAQPRNLVRPAFWAMLADIARFNRLASAMAVAGVEDELAMPVAEFLDRHAFGRSFRDWYFLPMIGCIWSCPTDQMLRFPIATLIRFCHNHGLLQVTQRPQWRTVRGGSRQYVQRMLRGLRDARAAMPVRSVRRDPQGGVRVATDRGSEWFDEVILACHSDQALTLLADARPDERAVLGAIRYQPNLAVLHTDAAVLPQRRRAWAAWNYVRGTPAEAESGRVCLHYLINRLQPLPWRRPVLVSLNPPTARAPDPRQVLGCYDVSHPVFDQAAIAAQRQLPRLQGRNGVWFCGAWTGYGFHEDGLASALEVVQRLRALAGQARLPAAAAEPA